MRYIIDAVEKTVDSGKPFVLATIVKSEGSSPRGVGASLIVDADGTQFGTIGGGAVEYEAVRHAGEILLSKRSETQLYRLRPNEIADLGMICGGQVSVLFQYFAADATTSALFGRLCAHRRAGKSAWLVRSIAAGAVTDTGVWDEEGLHDAGGMTDASLETACGARAQILETEDGGAEQILVEPVASGARVCIFGGGHVSQKLVPVLSYVDFRCTVCDDRAEFAKPALFPAAERVVCHTFSDAVEQLAVSREDYVVIMTRGHQADYEVLRQALQTPATYIGCIGSRSKIAITRKRLLEEGFSDADFSRVHTPIGLPILAETPEEIAVSVAAEMIAHRAKRG